jgi:hypothetical protein
LGVTDSEGRSVMVMSPVRLGTKNVLAKAGSNLPASYPARLTSGRTGGGV